MMIDVSSPPEYASTTFSGMSAPYRQPNRAAQQQIQNGFLNMHAIFRLLEDERVFRVHHFVSHFLTAMRRQTVQEHRVRSGFGHEFAIHLVRREDRGPLISLRFP